MDEEDLISSMAWFTLPLNRAQVVVSIGVLLLLVLLGVGKGSAGRAGPGGGLGRELDTLSELFSLLLERLRLKKLVCKKSRFHIDSSD